MSKVTAYARGQTADLVVATVALQKAVDAGRCRGQERLRRGPSLLRAHRAARGALPRARRQDRRPRGRLPEEGQGPDLDRLPPDRAHALARRRDHRAHAARSRPGSSATRDASTSGWPTRRSPPRWSSPARPSWWTRSRSRRSRARRSATRSSTCRRSSPTSRAPASSTTRSPRSCEAKDPELADEIDDAFQAAFDEVEQPARGGGFPAYDELTDAQQREVKQTIEALAEPLARVQGTLGVKG